MATYVLRVTTRPVKGEVTVRGQPGARRPLQAGRPVVDRARQLRPGAGATGHSRGSAAGRSVFRALGGRENLTQLVENHTRQVSGRREGASRALTPPRQCGAHPEGPDDFHSTPCVDPIAPSHPGRVRGMARARLGRRVGPGRPAAARRLGSARARQGRAGQPPAQPYETVRNFGILPDGRKWGSVSAVAVDVDGKHIWAGDRCGTNSCAGSDVNPIVKLDPERQGRRPVRRRADPVAARHRRRQAGQRVGGRCARRPRPTSSRSSRTRRGRATR